MQDAKEEVRMRLNIEDVVGEYVDLKRAGRNFKGLSPFSGEKTPSFYVSPDKNIWHDFSSNKGGDVFSFVMEVEGMDFRQALEHLAQKAGVDLTIYDSKGDQEVARMKKRLLEAHRLAAQYYQQSLIQNPHAVEYVFKKRALTKEIVQKFQIGYAPTSGNALVQFLTKKGFSEQELSLAGLTNRFGGDLFRGRMMVALMNATGQVIGFTARILEDDPNAPKYLNTPQTMLYDKGRNVFGLSQAKETIRTKDYAVIVEGNLDVVSSHQVGVTQVVATAGTAMTEHHLKALVRLTASVRLAFDGDKAGLAATERAVPIAQSVGVELSIISLPDSAKDPDELIQQGVELWEKAIETAEPAVDWILRQYAAREDLTSAAGKRSFTTAALNIIRELKDAVEKEHYVQKVVNYTGTSIEALTQKLEAAPEPVEKVLKKVVEQVIPIRDTTVYQESLLAVALTYPSTRELLEGVTADMFSTPDRQAVFNYVSTSADPMSAETPKALQEYDTYVKILLLKADARYSDWDSQDRYYEAARMIRQLITEHKKNQRDTLNNQLRTAEASGDDAAIAEITQKLNVLIKEIPHGKK